MGSSFRILIIAAVLAGTAYTLAIADSHAGITNLPTRENARRYEPGTLQQLVDAAVPGSTIVVAAGTYREHLIIDKPLILIGDEWPVIDGGGLGDVIVVKADGVVIRRLVVQGSGGRLWQNEAAIKIESSHNEVTHNLIVDSLFGIYLESAQQNLIADNRIQGRWNIVEHDRGDGIRLFDSNYNRLERNRIDTPRDGLYFEFANHNYIADNEISHARIGLHYMYADDNEFEHNLFVDNGVAATPMYAKRIVARHNIFARSRGYGAYGLFLKDAEDTVVEENLMLDNQVGIFMDGSVRGKFVKNIVAANDVGLRILSSSQGNVFTGNALIDNTDQVSLNSGIQSNLWDDSGVGNYWSDYRGYDLNGDAIGDIPHDATSVFAYLNESFPETRILHSSAPVQALAFAERMFPVLNLPQAIDRFPLMRAPAANAPTLPLPAEGNGARTLSGLALFGGLLLGGPFMLLVGTRLFAIPTSRGSRHP